MRKAANYYEKAIRLDPNYALAYASLANVEGTLITIFGVTDLKEREELIANARKAAATALVLEPTLGRAHYARGFILQVVDFDLPGAEAEYRRAAELAPQDSAIASCPWVWSLRVI